MPTAYLLAKDRIEQARAMLAKRGLVRCRDDHLLSVALARLDELDAGLSDDAPKVVPNPSQASPRIRLMPWLDKP